MVIYNSATTAATRIVVLRKRLSNHIFFLNKVFWKRTNNSHKFEGFFLGGQVSSDGFKVSNGFIVLFVFYWSACKNTKNSLPESDTFVHPKKKFYLIFSQSGKNGLFTVFTD